MKRRSMVFGILATVFGGASSRTAKTADLLGPTQPGRGPTSSGFNRVAPNPPRYLGSGATGGSGSRSSTGSPQLPPQRPRNTFGR